MIMMTDREKWNAVWFHNYKFCLSLRFGLTTAEVIHSLDCIEWFEFYCCRKD